jgi:hypothetical protein
MCQEHLNRHLSPIEILHLVLHNRSQLQNKEFNEEYELNNVFGLTAVCSH